MSTRRDLDRLVRAVRAIEGGGPDRSPLAAVPTRWPALDGPTRRDGAPAPGWGLLRGVLHEWYGLATEGEPDARGRGRSRWTPPLFLLAHLARQALGNGTETEWVLWIGRRVWPYPRTLVEDRVLEESDPGADSIELALRSRTTPAPERRRLLSRSLFVDPPDDAGRLWAIDASLRSPAVAAVVADGSSFGMAATRRLSLAAGSGRALLLLARPPEESSRLSAATTRWRVRTVAGAGPRWRVELLRSKGAQRYRDGTRSLAAPA